MKIHINKLGHTDQIHNNSKTTSVQCALFLSKTKKLK